MAGTGSDGKETHYTLRNNLMIQATAPTAATPRPHSRTNQASRW